MATKGRSSTAAARFEGWLLALAAILPTVPYGVSLLHGVPRFSMFGDYAIIEMMTRFVWSGRTLLGPYSRFHFSHPGPLYFYVLAPLYALCGGRSVAIFAGAFLINLAAAATIVVAARRAGSRAHALAAVLVVFGWVAAFGNVLVNPWNPLVITLPLAAFLVLAACVACGKSRAAWPAAFLGVLVAQSHVAAVTTVGVVGLAALGVFLRRRRGIGIARRERRHLWIALGVVVLTSVPPVIEQLTADRGNIRNLASFFLDRPAPLKTWACALTNWATATSWLPDRILKASLRTDRGVPLPMRWDTVPTVATMAARHVAEVYLVASVLAGLLAWLRRDRLSGALVVVGVAAEVIAISTLRGVVGDDYYYLVFWVTAGGTVTWLGVLAATFGGLADAIRRSLVRGRRPVAIAASLGLLVAGGAVARLQGAWISRNVVTAQARGSVRKVYAELLSTLRGHGESPVVHLDGAWTVATVVILELYKDGVPAYVVQRDRWVFGRAPLASEATNPLHVYVQEKPDLPLPVARCVTPLAASGDVQLFTSASDVSRCP